MNLDVTRWDPLTGTTSAIVASTVDMTDALFGMFTKPADTYKHEKRWREREAKREDANAADSASINSEKRNQRSLALTAAGASAKSFGMIVPKVAMSMVDVPLAFTEGLRVLPGRLGTNVRDTGTVTDATSGLAVAGKTLTWGLADGLSDLVMEPVRGGIKEGPVGVVKGVGRGLVSAVAKTGAGAVGVIAYPGSGIAKSIRAAVRGGTGRMLARARLAEGRWLAEEAGGLPLGVSGDALVELFHRLKSGRGKE